jgi:glycine cleavage system pyridoxal-binding protein P
MIVNLGDLVAGHWKGKHYLGIVSRFKGQGMGPNSSIYPHAVTWLNGHWYNALYTPYSSEKTVQGLREQFLDWQTRDYK